jgi:hypothetical protein
MVLTTNVQAPSQSKKKTITKSRKVFFDGYFIYLFIYSFIYARCGTTIVDSRRLRQCR